MKLLYQVFLFYYFLHAVSSRGRSCGRDNSPTAHVYEGVAHISRYPWMGMLYYPTETKRVASTVVLVTRQTCLTSAYEIDKMPKNDFRARTRVVIGQACGSNEIRVRDYTYHPDYKSNSYSALAMVQLETDHVKQELRPICPPPEVYLSTSFYAMTMYLGCEEPIVKIYKMQPVDMSQCQHFYRKSDLGFSVFGPGCGAPSRFLDYGKYHPWVRRSATTIGYPTITRIADNQIVMRRTSSNIQRFGPCDFEETRQKLYTDRQKLVGGSYRVTYNLSLYTQVEYACILFNADPSPEKDEFPGSKHHHSPWIQGLRTPKIRIRRWCSGPPAMCYGFQYTDIHFQVEMMYANALYFTVLVFGREPKIISPAKSLIYENEKVKRYPSIPTLEEIHERLIPHWCNRSSFTWSIYCNQFASKCIARHP